MTTQNIEAVALYNRSNEMKIETFEQASQATELLSHANKEMDALLQKEEKITKPALLVIKNERERWAPYKKMLKESIDLLRMKLSDYQTIESQRAAKEAQAIADRASRGTLKVETAVRKLSEIDAPEAKILTSNGSLTFRPKETLVIKHADKIPREYLSPDEDRLLKALQGGATIPGCTIVIIQVPFNRRA